MQIKVNHSIFKIIVGIAIVLFSDSVSAQIASWNFEPFTGGDTNPTPNIGSGTSSIVNNGGGTIGTAGVYQRTGMAGSGCGAQNGSTLGAWAFEPFAPGSSNESNGAQFNVSTNGYQNIIVTWDQRFSNTSANTVRLQYTTDGTNWNNYIMSGSNTTLCAGSINSNGCFENNAGDVYRRIAVDFTAITAVNNNPNFRVRIVASYYQSTTEYRQSAAPLTAANPGGTWRFDNITFSGTPITYPNPSVISNSGPSVICGSGSANIKVDITGGVSPYTVVYTDGTSNFTVNNYISGSNIAVAPTATKTYTIVSVTGANLLVGIGNSGSATVTYSSVPAVTFTAAAGLNSCIGSDVIYTTQAAQSNYVWTVSGSLGTDYSISSGSLGASSNTVTLKWLTAGSRSVTVNYSNAAGCSAASATSSVTTVYALPTITASSAATAVCSSTVSQTTPLTYSATTGSPTRYSIVWSSTPANTFAPITNLPLPGSIAITVPANTAGGTYTGTLTVANNTSGCTSVGSTFTVQVNARATIVTQPATASQSVCLGSPFTAITVGASGTGTLNYQWYRNTANVAVTNPSWVLLSPVGTYPNEVANGSKAASFTPLSNAVGTFYYYVKVNNTSAPCAVTTVNSAICGPFTVHQAVGGTVSGDANVCMGSNSTTLTLSGYTSSVLKWQSSPVSNFSSGVVDIANVTPTLTVSNITAKTYYRAVVTDGPASLCSTTSSVATLTVIPVSDGGTLSGGVTVCSATASTVLSLSGYIGAIVKWQSSPVSDFSRDVIDIVNTATTLSVNVAATTYYRVVVQNGSCSLAYSSVVQVYVMTTTWNGTLWDNGTPNSATKAVFASFYNENTDLQACSVEVLSGAIVTIPSDYTLTVQNEVDVVSSMLPTALIFEDSASLIQVNNVVNSSYIYYRRNSAPVKKYDYTYWSSPVANQILSTFSPNTLLSYVWNSGIYNWSYLANTSNMTAGRGYILRAPDVTPFNTITGTVFNGEFFGIPNNGTITTPVSVSGAGGVNDMNLIGNPYPGALDADSFLISNRPANGGVLNGTIFYWTHNTPITANGSTYNYSYSDYASYNLTGGVSTVAPSPSSVGCPSCNATIPNGKIGAGQSFFIQGLGNGVATFTNAMRFGVNSQFYRNTPNTLNQIEKNRLWLDISNQNGLFKQLLIGYIEGATNAFDTSFDGLSVDVGNAIMMYSVLDDKKLAIQGRALPFDVNDVILVGYKSTVAGTFEIKLSNVDGLFSSQNVYLEDTLTNTYYNLKNGNYSFVTEIGTFDSRFKIHFTEATLGIDQPETASFVVYQNENQIHVDAGTISLKDIEVYDIQGRILNKYQNISTSQFSFASVVKNEILILKITTADSGIFYKKIRS